MIALFTLLAVVMVSILITRVATIALVLTGLSEDEARFQARSVTTGTGFTTSESEHITEHPARRRIALILMVVQNAGLVTVISTFILSFVGAGQRVEVLWRGALLLTGLAALVFLAQNDQVDHWLSGIIERALKRYTDLHVRDYYTLLHLEEGYKVARFPVEDGTWLAGKTLRELDLPGEGVTVLTITRADDSLVCIARGRYEVHPGDVLTLYGKADRMADLRDRETGSSGEAARRQAESDHEEEKRQGDAQQSAREKTQEPPNPNVPM